MDNEELSEEEIESLMGETFEDMGIYPEEWENHEFDEDKSPGF